jgi:hypothetical protein
MEQPRADACRRADRIARPIDVGNAERVVWMDATRQRRHRSRGVKNDIATACGLDERRKIKHIARRELDTAVAQPRCAIPSRAIGAPFAATCRSLHRSHAPLIVEQTFNDV